jgi:hypothetical protein
MIILPVGTQAMANIICGDTGNGGKYSIKNYIYNIGVSSFNMGINIYFNSWEFFTGITSPTRS